MPDFTIVEAQVTGEIYIEEDSQYNNLNADSVFVAENVKARLFGTVHKSLTVSKGAVVQFHGTVKGTIENYGELYLH